MFYISLNDAVVELCNAMIKTKFYERFLDRICISSESYMRQLLIDYIWGSYINLYGILCLKGEKISNKLEMVSRDYLPMGGQHKYKWNVNYTKKNDNDTYEIVSLSDLDKDKVKKKEILSQSLPWSDIAELDLNSILSFNNELLYTDISIKRTDLAFLSNNLETYLMGIFSKGEKEEPKKKFSIMKFIMFWEKDKTRWENDEESK